MEQRPVYKSSLADLELTEDEQRRYALRPSLLARVEAVRERLGLARADLRILDWGCGRGRAVLALRDQGYAAFGVEIEAEPVQSGRGLARARGLEAERVLTVLDGDGRAPYDDGFFHFTCSTEVLEHVRDLDAVARELSRLTIAGGGGLHVFPARFAPIEPHLRMPFVHWLPKNSLRRAWIRACVALRVRTRSEARDDGHVIDTEQLSGASRADQLFHYTCEQTFYRLPSVIRATFDRVGVDAAFDTAASPSVVGHRLLGPLAREPRLAPLLNFALVHFSTVHLLLTRRAAQVSAGPGGTQSSQ